jgi:7-cyano-7-deazaguanine synthase in queuosine biosynthesis
MSRGLMSNLAFYDIETIAPDEVISIAWSGGIDSTYALKWLLENTQHPIYAYFVGMESTGLFEQSRINVELKACQDMLEELQQIRHFEFEVLNAHMPYATARVASLISMVQQANFRRNIYNIFIGLTKEESENVIYTDNPDEPILLQLNVSYQFSDTIAKAWEDFTRTADKAYKLHNKKRVFTRMKILPKHILGTKLEYSKYLGLSLVEKTFTCANTQWLLTNTTPCNTCIRCVDRNECITQLQTEL